jgi:CBS domain-containing protein
MLDDSPVGAIDFMTHTVVVVHPEDTVRHAVRLLAQHRISGVPVVDHAGELMGMFTEGDLVRWHEGLTERQSAWLERLGEGYEVSPTYMQTIRDANHLVRSVMSRGIVTIPDTISAREAAEIMYQKGIKRLPVMREGKLIGILSRSDLVRALSEALERAHPEPEHERHTVNEALRRAREEAVKGVPKLH